MQPFVLQAGPLSFTFEPATAFARRLTANGVEVLRGIYGTVRDCDWGTVPPRLEQLEVTRDRGRCRIIFGVRCEERDVDFFWRGEVVGTPEGTLTFDFDGVARATFLRARIGLCVLHPLAGCLGQPCVVEHADGQVEAGAFPRFISPHQPFKNIRAITHTVQPGLAVKVELAGEVFEMEDQRNWTDASFKTYGTPLDLPFPVRVEAGTRVQQRVTVRLLGPWPASAATRTALSGKLQIPSEPTCPRPAIGLGLASHAQPLTARQSNWLRPLELDHLRVDLPLASPTWRHTLDRAAREAGELGVGLHLALFLTDQAEAELAALARAVQQRRLTVRLWLVYEQGRAATSESCVRLALRALARLNADIPVAAGANANFAELNRNRLPFDLPVLPCFALNPQVHAFDPLSLVENLEAQGQVVESVRQFSSYPVVISPVTLRPRFNPVATRSTAGGAADALPAEVDPRQAGLWAAGWTLGSIAALSGAGPVHSLTYYETTGWRGVMETEAGSPLPGEFPSLPNTVFPIYHLLADLAGLDQIAGTLSPEPIALQALTLFGRAGQWRVLVANLTDQPQPVRLQAAAALGRLRVLDPRACAAAGRDPDAFRGDPGRELPLPGGTTELVLGPFALARLDLVK